MNHLNYTDLIVRLAAFVLATCTVATAAPATGQSEYADETKQLVVMIEGALDGAPTVGAGVIFGRDANRFYIVTANHVVRRGGREAQRVRVLLNRLPDQWLHADLTPHADPSPPGLDLAVLAVPGLKQYGLDLCILPLDRLGHPDALKRGAAVSPLGYPQGVIRWGTPVTPQRVAQVAGQEIQFESSVTVAGYSGGALLSPRGEVFGLIRSYDTPFAIATRIDTVLDVLQRWNYPVELRLANTPSPLFAAVVAGDSNAVERSLREPCVSVDERHEGWTALHKAADEGATAIVRALLRAGADTGVRIDNPKYKDFTPLQLAANNGHADVVRLLLEAGAGTEETGRGVYWGETQKTPLELAVWGGRREVVKVLRNAGARTEFVRRAIPGKREGPIHRAARGLNVEVARLLIDLGANVNHADNDGETPLFTAIDGTHDDRESQRRVEMVQLLLAAGAEANKKDGYGTAPLAKVIVECGFDDENEQRGRPPREPGLLKIAKLLIDAGARLDHVRGEGEERQTAIGLASYYGQVDVVEFLLKAGAKVNERNGRGQMPLHEAAEMGGAETSGNRARQLALLEFLLGAGADVNAKGYKGDPPLCRALWGNPANPRIKIVEILLKAGARPIMMKECNWQSGRAWAPNEEIDALLRSYKAR